MCDKMKDPNKNMLKSIENFKEKLRKRNSEDLEKVKYIVGKMYKKKK